MSQIQISKVPIVVGQQFSGAMLGAAAGVVNITIEHEGVKVVLSLDPTEAEGLGAALIKGGFAAVQMADAEKQVGARRIIGAH